MKGRIAIAIFVVMAINANFEFAVFVVRRLNDRLQIWTPLTPKEQPSVLNYEQAAALAAPDQQRKVIPTNRISFMVEYYEKRLAPVMPTLAGYKSIGLLTDVGGEYNSAVNLFVIQFLILPTIVNPRSNVFIGNLANDRVVDKIYKKPVVTICSDQEIAETAAVKASSDEVILYYPRGRGADALQASERGCFPSVVVTELRKYGDGLVLIKTNAGFGT